ncbi:hypothetical protein P171DRAFT_479312 [Karstenula rhodostoma CBS 690.94]|uniref:Secreted protein n=1 Tax=Karstenula rhodostoma CBS 690.94 TaxID=1392251 RepID=A0A9P4PRX2_9PLEO|nr:hypothetical protein P171DRAFT_479312 [Karstenula rhodostoma CBS 690.94]
MSWYGFTNVLAFWLGTCVGYLPGGTPLAHQLHGAPRPNEYNYGRRVDENNEEAPAPAPAPEHQASTVEDQDRETLGGSDEESKEKDERGGDGDDEWVLLSWSEDREATGD